MLGQVADDVLHAIEHVLARVGPEGRADRVIERKLSQRTQGRPSAILSAMANAYMA